MTGPAADIAGAVLFIGAVIVAFYLGVPLLRRLRRHIDRDDAADEAQSKSGT